MLNEGDEEVWCSWDKNDNWLYGKKTLSARPTLLVGELRPNDNYDSILELRRWRSLLEWRI